MYVEKRINGYGYHKRNQDYTLTATPIFRKLVKNYN